MSSSVTFVTAGKIRVREETPDIFFLYHDERGYETNIVGVEIVKRCATGVTLTDLCMHLTTIFDAPITEIEKDCKNVLNEFVACGLLIANEASS